MLFFIRDGTSTVISYKYIFADLIVNIIKLDVLLSSFLYFVLTDYPVPVWVSVHPGYITVL